MHDSTPTVLPTEIDAVLFDMDDTLVDSERAWAAATVRLWQEHGVDDQPESVPGGSVADVVDLLVAARPGLDAAAVTSRYLALLDRELGGEVRPMPGARALVERLDPRLPLAVASNSPSAVVRRTVAALGWQERMSAALGTDDVARPKPAPDLYLEAARRCGARIERCVVLEDSGTGARAATEAGAFVVTVGEVRPRHACVSSLLDPLVTAWDPRPWRPR